MLSETPSYLRLQLGFSIQNAGMLCVVPYFASLSGMLFGGKFFTTLEQTYKWNLHSVRTSAQFTAFLGAGSVLLICGYTTSPVVALAALAVCQFLLAQTSSSVFCAYLDVAPNHSAMLSTFGNTIAAAAGMMGPIVCSALTSTYHGSEGWQATFWLTFAQCVVACTAWWFFVKSTIIAELND